MKHSAVRMLVALTALCVIAAGCGKGGGHGSLTAVGDKWSKMDAGSVKPPVGPDTQRQALPGVLLGTNSPSWVKLLGSPKGAGAVVLFIQPGGPTDNKGIALGDLLTDVDGIVIANAERAVSVLHSRVGEKRTLTFRRTGRKDARTITIIGRTPRGNPRTILNPEIANNPTDPVLRYLRAYTGGNTNERLADLAKALEGSTTFADALQLRASLTWAASFSIKDAAQRQKVQTQALAGWKNALDIDPRNETTLAVRAIAFTDIGTPKTGEADAQRSLRIDGTQPLALFALSRARLAENHPQQAIGPAAGAVDLMPYNLDYWKNLASMFMKLKRKSDCVKTTDAFAPYLRARQGQAFVKAANDLRKVCA